MCNLYTTKASAAEVASAFAARKPASINAGPGDVYPSGPGMVVRNDDGQRIVQAMTWGFPLRLKTMKPGSKPKPVNNARTDKLDSFMWRYSFEERRCLIPLSAWAEAEGPKGSMTRTWLSLPDSELFAAAGIWRQTDEWGTAYSMVMTDCCDITAEVHERMPVLLAPDDWERWMNGSPEEAMAMCRPWQGAVTIERTSEPWVKR